jgi:antitoxin MazE
VRIPGAYASDLDFKEGMEVDVALVEGGILLRAPPCRRYPLDELVAAITPENVHVETDWGEAAGRESW